MREYVYIIDKGHDGWIIQDYLKNVHKYSSRIIVKVKQEKNSISVNGVHARMVDKLRDGDILYIMLEDFLHIKPNKDLYARILYNDRDLIIYDKPPNMPVHPVKSHQLDTLANVFANYCEYSRESSIFRPINRLDSNTSGLCVVAKNQLVAHNLSKRISKKYYAVLCGEVVEDFGTINLPIGRVEEILIKRKVCEDGKPSVTNYVCLEKSNNYSLVDIELETGRTHQIRVHFSHIGYPLAGDSLYGGKADLIARQALHCYNVCFVHPITDVPLNIFCELPKDISELLSRIKSI